MPAVKGWLLAEDAAMKAHLSGYSVTDATAGAGGRQIQVWFRNPEPEERPRTYPYISIDLIDVSESVEGPRHMTNRLKVSDLAYPLPDPLPASATGSTYLNERPLPIDLDYQITSNARHAMHDRALLSLLMRRFPGKWGALHVPGDDTARSMFSLGMTSSTDTDTDGKRLYRRTVRVRVLSEMWPADIRQYVDVSRVDFTIIGSLGSENPDDYTGIDLNCHTE